ncbi:tRNA (adenosine(37)-N6)-threonylcarbamoyltransferase complex dimerization subunit type 1 TsaB [Methylocystis bryophila]|uniref:tRNA (Adenosine(37)-N6)-threonylcarbamoyltransferase complex dimerization subunit type 1 TsaB n=1 Tax=Methylocystis bryophila TaxID=655015 RepID=A0A1W6N137_9HYPH|nr:tRNA (adenosine(37)-N6)-threonylcarbamoyltransferase complex dimerization subunit type 1 TsaB [Methylocystis bryophila]ARN83545.1 tRNA (adenosine(37)-N6)-threonylcarbamoyltransferase complex dimerization subunit type 1 TsaB [Methylocystis bryophila]
MRILAIDTALPAVSGCVLDLGAAAPLAIETIPMERGHAEALLPLVDRLLASTEGGFASLNRVAATVGPGSFTGIRIGLAAAQAIARALKIEAVGVSTLAALAAPHFSEPFEGLLVPSVDARHGQVFVAAYSASGRLVLPPQRMVARQAVESLRDFIGEQDGLHLVGSGATMLERAARGAQIGSAVLDSAVAPDIACVARLGLLADPREAPARPLYLKSADVTMAGGAAPPVEA